MEFGVWRWRIVDRLAVKDNQRERVAFNGFANFWYDIESLCMNISNIMY